MPTPESAEDKAYDNPMDMADQVDGVKGRIHRAPVESGPIVVSQTSRGPVAVCALLDKPSRRQVSVEVGYVGLTVPDQFIVGYGTDLDQKYRQLPEIYILEE